MSTIVLTGGGTGGHVIPCVSLLPELRKHFDRICYIGTNGIEKELISKQKGVEYFEISATKFQRRNKIKNISLPFKLIKSVCEAKKILKDIRPDVIFSKGGYVSLPVCIASYFLKLPIVSHESDLSLGKANKIIYKLSTSFCTTFEKTTEGLKKAVYTGAPIRESLFNGSTRRGMEITHFDLSRPVVLVTGGSTGAEALNDVIYTSLPLLTKKYDIIHLTGKNKLRKIRHSHYVQMEYCHEIEHLFKIADVVVSRAGSGAIYELLALKKCMILVPLPKGNSRGDQVENAKYFESRGYARVIEQENLNAKSLCEAIDNLVVNKDKYIKVMEDSYGEKTEGVKNIVSQILLARRNNQ